MTPIDGSGFNNDHSGSYSGEAKTEFLVLCSKLNAPHHQKSPPQPSKHRLTEAYPMFASHRLVTLRSSDRLLEKNQKNVLLHKPPLPAHLSCPGLTSNNSSFQSKLVKVSVYTKAVNPYVVVYESNKKYAKPSAYLKLVNCTVKAGSDEGCLSDDDNNNDDDDDDSCMFRIIPSKHEDDDTSSVIVLRASSVKKRDEWVKFLDAVCNGKGTESSTGYVPGSSVLPTLVEQDDSELSDEAHNSLDELNSPIPKRKHREGRRSSLNSLGMRLRCYSLGKSR